MSVLPLVRRTIDHFLTKAEFFKCQKKFRMNEIVLCELQSEFEYPLIFIFLLNHNKATELGETPQLFHFLGEILAVAILGFSSAADVFA